MALNGLKVFEFAGLAPGPFAGMVLADFGADVVRIDRSDASSTMDVLARGKRSIQVNLKDQAAVAVVRRLLATADVLIDPFRPGVLERLGLGPDVLLKDNPRLVYARLTGFGQTGPLANMAGHDINYIAITGVLAMLGRKGERPMFPANLLGDFAGGGMLCVVGILLALLERQRSGQGQVVDAAMVDGSTYLSSFIFKMRQRGFWNAARGENMLDSGAPFYEVYETKDGKYMAVGSIEPQFYRLLLKGLGLDPKTLPAQMDMSSWDELKATFAAAFKTKTRDEWSAVFVGTDACVTPVIEPDEAPLFAANRERSVLVAPAGCDVSDAEQYEPAPAPRLSRTPGRNSAAVEGRAPEMGAHTADVLREAGFSADEITRAHKTGLVGRAPRPSAASLSIPSSRL
ncbi:alpha-methylacyl-CoA racemase [Entophlyctis helioformis]|nr:alpha-methylacyl-CoA racemase [Entophlyctis helioformis]